MFKFKNEAERATVYLYGTIGADWWDEDSSNTAKAFAQTLDSLGGKPLDIRVDSLGGDVYEGFAIASAIQRYSGDTTCYVDGIAASAASYVAIMADKVVMASFAQFMIHDAWTFASGNAQELTEMAARLDELDGTIAGIIAARTGMGVDEVRKAMDAETWYGADAAIEAGLADEKVETQQRVAASLDYGLLARYRNVPEGLATIELKAKSEPVITADLIVAGVMPTNPEPAPEPKSHAENTIPSDEGRTRSFVLGNKVYETKE